MPKIHPIQLNQTRHREAVLLKCDAAYQNENFGIISNFNVILSWMKDGKILANKTVNYEYRNHTVSLKHSLTVNSFRDGGDYVCVSQLALKDKTDFVNDSKKVELQSKLNVQHCVPFLICGHCISWLLYSDSQRFKIQTTDNNDRHIHLEFKIKS